MLNSIVANIVAGLGLFFSGLRMVDTSLRQATGRQLKSVIGRLTRNAWMAGLVGVLTGALVQSSSGIVFILVSLVTSGLTSVRKVLPIVTWANVGCSALVFVTVLDLRLAILYLMGVAGFALAFDRSHRSHALGAVFGVGMLFYGIELMKIGVQPLDELSWFAPLLNGSGGSFALSFVSGAAFSFVTQSATAVSIVAIGIAQAGLLGPFPTMMAVYGANVGSTFARMVLSSTLRGSVRQLTAYQDLFKITGGVLFVILLYLEAVEGVPLVYAFVSQVFGRIDRQMAMVFFLFNLTMAVTFTLGQPVIYRLLEERLPADEHEELSGTQFLYAEALDEPATALDLIDHEQLRLAKRLASYLNAIRGGPGSPERAQARLLARPFAAVAARIDEFQHELLNRPVGVDEAERLVKLQARLSLIVYLEESLRSLATATESVARDGRLGALVSSLVEGLDFVLMTLVDALEQRGGEGVEVLVKITEDRGALVERIRREYLADEASIGAADRVALFQVTAIFERAVWMMQRMAQLFDRPGVETAR